MFISTVMLSILIRGYLEIETSLKWLFDKPQFFKNLHWLHLCDGCCLLTAF